MINNWRRSIVAWIAALTLVSACRPKSGAPPGYQGIVEYDERLVAFEVAGRIAHVDVHRGDEVKEGDVLARVDDAMDRLARDARAEDARAARADLELVRAGSRREDVASLAAQLRAADASEDLAAKAVERARALVQTQAISQAELDRAQAEYDRVRNERASMAQRLGALQKGARPEEIARAKARAEAAEAALAQADERLAHHTLRAGVPGVALDVFVDPGELASVGAPAVTLADTTHPYVDVFVPEGELGGIRTGNRAHVRVDSEPAPIDGAIEHVFSRAEFTPKFVFSDRERPNIVVRVRVRVNDGERRLHAGVPAFVVVDR